MPNFWFGSVFGWFDVIIFGTPTLLIIMGLMADFGTCMLYDLFKRIPKRYKGTFDEFNTREKK